MEPVCSAKVIVETTIGPLDVELWSKECPVACRNFIQHCLDGYYNGCLFHRVVKGYLAQTGDPTGTGEGGVAAFGDPFKRESHSRLRFTRRGLVGMAGGHNDNRSQFFITLEATPHLDKQHTLMGRVTGESAYNLVKFREIAVDDKDRPEAPITVLKTSVVVNPFPDLQQREQKEEIKKKKKAKTKKKNLALLSFAQEEEEEEVHVTTQQQQTKSKSLHDFIAPVSTPVSASNDNDRKTFKRSRDVDTEPSRSIPSHHVDERTTDTGDALVEDSEAQYRLIKQQLNQQRKKHKANTTGTGTSVLAALTSKYKTKKQRRAEGEHGQDVLSQLALFEQKITSTATTTTNVQQDDDEDSYLKHKFEFAVRPQDYGDNAVHEYEVRDTKRDKADKEMRRTQRERDRWK